MDPIQNTNPPPVTQAGGQATPQTAYVGGQATPQTAYTGGQANPTQTVVQNPPQPVANQPVLEPNPQPAPEKKSKLGLILGVLLAFIILLTASTGTFAYVVAYEKVDIGNDDLQRKISHVVMSIPFTPKTPRYVLENAILAHSKTSSHSFDASASVASESFVSDFGLSSFDVKFAGSVDYTDLANINFDTTVDITNKFQAFVRKIDTVIYTKIEKLPTELLVFLGINSENLAPIIANWVKYDITPLDSEARSLIEEDIQGESYTNQIATRVMEALIDREILASMDMSTEEYEGEQVYHLEYRPSAAEIDYLFQSLEDAVDDPEVIDVQRKKDEVKMSEIVTNLEIILRISTSDQLLRWASVKSSIETTDADDLSVMITPYVEDDQKIDLAFVLKLSDFNQQVDIVEPAESITFEEYAQRIMEAVNPEGNFGILPAINPGRQFAQTRDTQRRSDLLQITNAIYQFAAEHDGNLPDTDNDDSTSNFPTTPTCIGTGSECFDLASAGSESGVSIETFGDVGLDASSFKDSIVPTYISNMPQDPSIGISADTGYTIYVNTNGRLVAEATGELTPSIKVER